MDKHMVSVIIPAYNVGKYLGTCLDSVLAQTYKNIEIVVVNDGSSDNSGEVAEEYAKKDSRVRVIHNKNGGVSKARGTGVQNATGDFISFIDGDDIIDNDMYERLVNNAVKYDADISHCGYQRVTNSKTDFYNNTGKLICQNHTEGLYSVLKGDLINPSLCNKMFKKSLFDGFFERQIINKKYKINEDLLWNYCLFKSAEKTVFEDFCPYHYIVRIGSASTASISKTRCSDIVNVSRDINDDIDEKSELKKLSQTRFVRNLASVASMTVKDKKSDLFTYRKTIRKELRHSILSILFGNNCSMNVKLIALWAAVWPYSFSMVHKFYSKVTGVEKKYSKD